MPHCHRKHHRKSHRKHVICKPPLAIPPIAAESFTTTSPLILRNFASLSGPAYTYCLLGWQNTPIEATDVNYLNTAPVLGPPNQSAQTFLNPKLVLTTTIDAEAFLTTMTITITVASSDAPTMVVPVWAQLMRNVTTTYQPDASSRIGVTFNPAQFTGNAVTLNAAIDLNNSNENSSPTDYAIILYIDQGVQTTLRIQTVTVQLTFALNDRFGVATLTVM
jgi:hypothetical protein